MFIVKFKRVENNVVIDSSFSEVIFFLVAMLPRCGSGHVRNILFVHGKKYPD